MALPDDIAWDSTNQWGRDWLRCGRKIVAGVSQTVFEDGRWIARVNRHDETGRALPSAYFRSRGAALRSVERWACAHAERLRREVATGAREKKVGVQPSREEKRLARQMRG
ncbi:hypothetical protein [Xanthomonas translucens]|uniref:hypothetical protein n=1 Tax=Xanthomonas campestris pv. translucens TaxID=343 RepID=UPI000D2202E9|nr:hypothetical protein [Xanthomonas translucens]AVY67145.1 hypothetical protein NZ30_12675 [Xanthomonas translucens pv. undulosa]